MRTKTHAEFLTKGVRRVSPKKTKKPKEKEEKQRKTKKNAVSTPEKAETDPIGYTEDELLASLCQDSFYKFVRTFWSVVIKEKPVWNWHIEALCHELQRMAERVFLGQSKEEDLIINISPGTTKSTIVSIMFPAWVWTRMPSARVISACYAHTLAMGMSRKSRDIIISDLYQKLWPEIQLRVDQDAKHHYVNTQGGERYATGVGGAILGNHAHFIIVDDPLNPTQAASDIELENANRWMDETLAFRKVDKAVTPTILIMQRLHENDPTGHRLKKAKYVPVRWICLPAELSEDVKPVEYRAYYVDGLMDPYRLGESVLAEAQSKGEYVWASQFMQTPIPRGGAMFIVAKLGDPRVPPRMVRTVRGWDKAGTQDGGTFTAGTKMGVDDTGRFWILDVKRVQYDSGRREQLIRRTAVEDGKHVRIGVEQESNSGGKQSAEGTVRNLQGFTVSLVKVGRSDGDKSQRADAFSSQVNVGNVSLAIGPWNDEFIHELRFFPRSTYKDQVDSASLSFNMLAGRRIRIGGGGLLRQQH